jgi:hypothetical protein
MHIKHTPLFDLAYRFVTETNLNIFLTGKAGTGKTTFLKYLQQNSQKKMVIAAPTGVAAINAGGVTLHSLFQLPFGPFIPAEKNNAAGIDRHSLLSKIRLNHEKLNLFYNLELLIIDEVSMVPAYIIDAVDTILRSVRRMHHLPFGGVQVLFIGDLYQLQPVVKREEWEILKDYYQSVFFFDSRALLQHPPVMIELKEIFRQKDEKFVNMLNEIRNNELSTLNLELLNSRLDKNFTGDEEGYITLTTHNAQAARINETKLNSLKDRFHRYDAKIKGEFSENSYPAEKELQLKKAAQVMFIKNDTEGRKYFNGKIGVVESLNDMEVVVNCDDVLIKVEKQQWENISYTVDQSTKEIKEEILGSFEQFPLRLAWAITIHKSQGLTFEKLIIDAENAFANGQVYVALSRAVSLEGLVLKSPVNRNFLGARGELKSWQSKQEYGNMEELFLKSRHKFIGDELLSIFNWSHWSYQSASLKKVIEENKSDLSTDSISWLKNISEAQHEIQNVFEKFRAHIIHLSSLNPVIEENESLQTRISEAANYFLIQLSGWKNKFISHPFRADTKKLGKKIDGVMKPIAETLEENIFRLELCKNGFKLNEYLNSKKNAKRPEVKLAGSYNPESEAAVDLSTDELYISLAEMRKRISLATGKPLFSVFNNKTILNVCTHLPKNKQALLNVNGFGKKKVEQFGDEVIKLVLEYCEEKATITI